MIAAGSPLYSAALKLDWAHRHLQLIEADMRAFYQPDNEASGSQDDAKVPGELSYKPWEPPPVTIWSLALGDAIHSLHCSLDHIAYALAVKNLSDTKIERMPDRRTSFPIMRTQNSGQFAEKTGDIHPDAVKEIERLQPYDRRNCLWFLAELSNADKHHQLSIHSARISAVMNLSIGPDQPVEIGLANGRVFTVDPATGKPEKELQPRAALSVALEVNLPRTGETVPFTALQEVHDFIASDVFPVFARFFT